VAHVYECGEILRTFKEKIRKGSVGKALCNLTCMVRLCKGKELLCTEKEVPPRLIWYRVLCPILTGGPLSTSFYTTDGNGRAKRGTVT
jgi:hypothetical protein